MSYLLLCEALEKTNATTIAHVFMQAIELLWNGTIHHHRVLIVVSDVASYMTSAASSLKVLFNRMLHVTCLVLATHRAAEEIRVLLPRVDRLIANMKTVLLKAPSSRIASFNENLSLPLPPKPILTRWGRGFAAEYHAEHFEVLERFVYGDLRLRWLRVCILVGLAVRLCVECCW